MVCRDIVNNPKILFSSESPVAVSPFSKGVAAGRGIFQREFCFQKCIPLLSPFTKRGTINLPSFHSPGFRETGLACPPFQRACPAEGGRVSASGGRGIFQREFCFQKCIPLLSPFIASLRSQLQGGRSIFLLFILPV
jgi:hypothetical protein